MTTQRWIEHPHDAIINNLIIEIKKKKGSYNIIRIVDGNEFYVNVKGGMTKLCRKYHI